MFYFKYTDEQNELRNELKFAVSDEFIANIVSIERDDIGTKLENTLVVTRSGSFPDVDNYNFYISREQHNSLVDMFNESQMIKRTK